MQMTNEFDKIIKFVLQIRRILLLSNFNYANELLIRWKND